MASAPVKPQTHRALWRAVISTSDWLAIYGSRKLLPFQVGASSGACSSLFPLWSVNIRVKSQSPLLDKGAIVLATKHDKDISIVQTKESCPAICKLLRRHRAIVSPLLGSRTGYTFRAGFKSSLVRSQSAIGLCMGACLSSQQSTDFAESEKAKVRDVPTSLDLTQFELRRVVGKGAFGKVKVVVHKDSGNTYALKYISKVACVARQAAANVIRERKILEILCHPLVCNLRFAFQDSEYLYLVSDLMLGGDLRFHLLRKTFTEETIRHWIAETTAALSYCHGRGIVHRDVKPDNILLTADGHTKLADFNISTQIRNNVFPHSRSGSLFYMAPEVHEGIVYDFAVDYWSLGVVMYEAIYGHRPFLGKNNVEVSHNIRTIPLLQPIVSPPVSAGCQDVLSALLERSPSKRVQSMSAVAVFPFFATLDWPAVAQGRSLPEYIPGSGKNFDAAWELEEILLHDSPLESRRPTSRKRPTTENVTENEMYELMEKHFTDFDFTMSPGDDFDERPASFSLPKRLTSDASLPKRLTSDASIPSGFTAVVETDYVITEEVQSIDDKPLPNEAEVIEVVSSKSRHGLFKSKAKKPVIIPPGVLAVKAGARVRV